MDEGVYLASIRSFYRILNGLGESVERRLQAQHVKRSPPILEANGPNQVWTWDITRIPGPCKGQFYFLYVMIDIFSRYVVGWMLAERENARRAQTFIRETASKHLHNGEKVKVHNDRGSPMTAGGTQELFDLLGLEQSFSRPRTSDDNPFSESQFKTLKYANSYPMFVESLGAGEKYLDSWINWYNYEHQHKGLNLHTPASVQFNSVEEVISKRQCLMDLAYANNPERFPKGRPLVKANPSVVGINLRFKQGTTVTVQSDVEAVMV
jgi:putative transposase